MSNEEFQKAVLEKLNNVESEMTSVKSEMASMKSQISTMDKKIDKLDSKLNAVYDQTALLTEFKLRLMEN